MNQDFQDFLNSDQQAVPESLTQSVFQRMQNLLQPSPVFVFIKVLSLHTLIGFFSLAICHQFEMNPFNTPVSLADWFMSLGGHSICMLACGILFVGLSIVLSGHFLSIEEIRSLRRTEFLQSLALALMSLVVFYFSGADLDPHPASLWLLGALMGGYLATEAIWKIKRSYP